MSDRAPASTPDLPPGQRRVDEFPRFGFDLKHPPPEVPEDPVIEIGGLVEGPVRFPLAELAKLPRREIVADFHCVAGWTATGLRWDGVAFPTVFREIIQPELPTGVTVTHFAFEGLDGWRSIATAEDVLDDSVLIADTLDGAPLSADHGAPVRLVSPSQYGFISTKHLCRIDAYAESPEENYHPSRLIRFGVNLVKPHTRARVWKEERHRYLPSTVTRVTYRVLVPVLKSFVSRVGDPRRQGPASGPSRQP